VTAEGKDEGVVGATSAPPEPDPVERLERSLGIPFRDRSKALSALTHKSYVNEHREEAVEDNERLEFLGDAVVDLLVSHRLMERFPKAREGELSKMRAAVVDETGLAAMARALELGGLLRLGRGEELTAGREKSSLLADAMEAVIAAVFLEGGLAAAQALVDRFLEDTYARASAGTLDRDYKTQMQELCQSRFRLSPRYRVTAELGPDHLKTFEVEVEVKGEPLGRGTGRSKKDAEQMAARHALEALLSRPAPPDIPEAPPPPEALPPRAAPAEPAPRPAAAREEPPAVPAAPRARKRAQARASGKGTKRPTRPRPARPEKARKARAARRAPAARKKPR